jgi:hypothetical protein
VFFGHLWRWLGCQTFIVRPTCSDLAGELDGIEEFDGYAVRLFDADSMIYGSHRPTLLSGIHGADPQIDSSVFVAVCAILGRTSRAIRPAICVLFEFHFISRLSVYSTRRVSGRML